MCHHRGFMDGEHKPWLSDLRRDAKQNGRRWSTMGGGHSHARIEIHRICELSDKHTVRVKSLLFFPSLSSTFPNFHDRGRTTGDYRVILIHMLCRGASRNDECGCWHSWRSGPETIFEIGQTAKPVRLGQRWVTLGRTYSGGKDTSRRSDLDIPHPTWLKRHRRTLGPGGSANKLMEMRPQQWDM